MLAETIHGPRAKAAKKTTTKIVANMLRQCEGLPQIGLERASLGLDPSCVVDFPATQTYGIQHK